MNVPTAPSLLLLSIADLKAYYAPPAPVADVALPTTDVATYMGTLPNGIPYIEQQDKDWFQRNLVDLTNSKLFFNYSFALDQWANVNYRKTPLPSPPVYVKLDDAAFVNWYAAFSAWWTNHTAGTPPPTPTVETMTTPLPALPAPVITGDPALPANTSPIGAYDGGGIYFVVAGDTHKDGEAYSDSSGTYVKRILTTPFGVTQYWFKVA